MSRDRNEVTEVNIWRMRNTVVELEARLLEWRGSAYGRS